MSVRHQPFRFVQKFYDNNKHYIKIGNQDVLKLLFSFILIRFQELNNTINKPNSDQAYLILQ
jgi:hypothetical protein